MHGRLLLWSLRERRWRHAVHALVMAITVAVMMLFVSVLVELVTFARASSDRELARSVISPKIMKGTPTLPAAFFQQFQKIDGVVVLQRYRVIRGRHPSGANYRIAGEEDSGIELNHDIFPVDKATEDAWKKDRLAAIVTDDTAAELGLKLGQLAEIPTPYGPMQIKVAGFSTGGLVGHRMAVHFDYLQELTKDQGSCQYRLFTKQQDFKRIAREIVEMTKNSPTPAIVISDTLLMSSWVKRVSVVPALLGFLALFLILTTALTLANGSAIAIRDRRIETATLRVIGFRRSTVARMLLSEAVLVGFAGGLLAVIMMAVALHSGVQLTPGTEQLLHDVKVGPLGIACGLLTAVLVPLAGALPSTLASVRQPLVTALRDNA